MLRKCLVAGLLLVALPGSGKDINWIEGVIVLRDETVLKGWLSHQPAETIIFKGSDNRVSVYPAHLVSSFRYFDKDDKINRVFISRSNKHLSRSTYCFYESVISGWIRVYRSVKTHLSNITEKRANEFDYFVDWNDQLVPLRQFRQLVYPFIRKEAESNGSAAKIMRGLNPNRKDQALQMILIFNKSYTGTSMAGI